MKKMSIVVVIVLDHVVYLAQVMNCLRVTYIGRYH